LSLYLDASVILQTLVRSSAMNERALAAKIWTAHVTPRPALRRTAYRLERPPAPVLRPEARQELR
jgi:hypothetical protein